ncbi:MAG: hypothetical protein ACI8W8_000760 [Rhodothermales bacterium]|jgi:hypothetical protein
MHLRNWGAAEKPYFVSDELDGWPGITADTCANFGLDGQLFAKLAGQRLLGRLAGLDFAAGKLPEARRAILKKSLRDEDEVPIAQDRSCNCGQAQLSKAASNWTLDGLKSTFLTKAAASVAPWSRSMRVSSHSTDSGPV